MRAAFFILLSFGASCAIAQTSGQVTFLNQNWKPDQSQWFYHQTQGTVMIPYGWFVAMEQPLGTGLFKDPAYMARFGFLVDGGANAGNPDNLPVGFTKTPLPTSATASTDMIGLTCAACHTGQVNYKGAVVRIDGGPAMIDLDGFQQETVAALLLNRVDPPKYDRFAHRVLGTQYSAPAATALGEALDKFLLKAAAGAAKAAIAEKLSPVRSTTPGIGRLDAIGGGGNRLLAFGGIDRLANYRATNAPVSYPALWNAPALNWVQYNGSIEQPMSRNSIEALGVGVPVMLSGTQNLYSSSLPVNALWEIEQALRKLQAPPWPQDVLGKLDQEKVQRGKALYDSTCRSCHSVVTGPQPPESIKVTMVDLAEIGTDPNHATNFKTRTVDTGDLHLGAKVPAAEALKAVVSSVVDLRYKQLNISPDKQKEMNGSANNNWRAPLAYRARPLDGIWSTAPYLHNGSVPNLYQMLLPPELRAKSFYVGSREFDPRNVGFDIGAAPGSFFLDTTVSGNSNRGHLHGTDLSDAQRWDLIEYLKTL